MLENLIFTLNCIAPYFFLILLGVLIQKSGKMPESFFPHANDFVFKVALPLNLFCSIAFPVEGTTVSARFLLFTVLGTISAFALSWILTELLFRDKTIVGTLVQGAFRGNFILLGAPIVASVSGSGALQKTAFVSMLVIPLYNMLSVVALTVRSKHPGRADALKMLRNMIRNPLIVSTLCALPFFFLHIPLPSFAVQTMNMVGQCATPLGLLAVGATFRLKDATARLRPALYATFLKTIPQPIAYTTLGYLLGFRGDELMITMVLFAAPVAISSYPMTVAMDGDAPLASNILILTTAVSAVVLAVGIYTLRAVGLF